MLSVKPNERYSIWETTCHLQLCFWFHAVEESLGCSGKISGMFSQKLSSPGPSNFKIVQQERICYLKFGRVLSAYPKQMGKKGSEVKESLIEEMKVVTDRQLWKSEELQVKSLEV